MSLRTAFEFALIVLIAGTALLAAAILIVKAVRESRARRAAALAAEVRPRVLAALEGEDTAAAVLRGRRATVARDMAMSLLPNLRGAERDALTGLMRAGGVIARARADLSERSADRRRRAAELLGAAAERSASGALITRLRDRDPAVRAAAARALGRIGDPAAATPLLSALADRRASANTASMALLRLGAGAGPALTAALTARDVTTRAVAAELSGSLGVTGARGRLEALLHDEAPHVRAAAARALGRIGLPDTAAGLIGRLEALMAAADGDGDEAVAVARALGHVGDPAAVAVLRRALGRRHRLGFAAAAALAELGPGRPARRPRGGVAATAPMVAVLRGEDAAAEAA